LFGAWLTAFRFRSRQPTWYRSGKPVLGELKAKDRLERLEEMRRLLLAIIPRERGKKMK
jgi:hypothetical protein